MTRQSFTQALPIILLAGLLAMSCGAGEEPASDDAATAEVASETESAPGATQDAGARFEFTSTDYWDSGITYHVTSPNSGSINRVTITPSGLERDNSPIEIEVDGTIMGAEVGDLNADGAPEIYVYAVSAGSGSYGSLIGYSPNNRKSLTPVYLPPVSDNPETAPGYMGHDEFAVVENSLVQRFPVYEDGDTNAQPTGGTRQVQYRLEAGEAGWVLRPYNVVEY